MKFDFELCLPRDSTTVVLVRAKALDVLTRFGVTEDCIDDVRLAVSEACTNVIKHAEASDEYEVHLCIDGVCCELRVIDAGRGFEAAVATHPMPDPMSPGGRGMALMHARVDEVGLQSEPRSGTLVRLVKELETQPGSALGERPT